ncbi:sigma 54-interacting transcriptional regulator, partial [Bradyrhizobium sp.]|uniref:sigma 54-interacting transcriptional regulator n=1 Tax=Bradyrhizobium sp. TaxID=376 RepID=UPI003C17BAF3
MALPRIAVDRRVWFATQCCLDLSLRWLGNELVLLSHVRVLAATHRDLDVLVAEGKFREDLLYRLNVVPIVVPSLRERADDLPLLVGYFMTRFGKNAGKKFRAI